MSVCSDPSMGDEVHYQDKDKLGLCPGLVTPVCVGTALAENWHVKWTKQSEITTPFLEMKLLCTKLHVNQCVCLTMQLQFYSCTTTNHLYTAMPHCSVFDVLY